MTVVSARRGADGSVAGIRTSHPVVNDRILYVEDAPQEPGYVLVGVATGPSESLSEWKSAYMNPAEILELVGLLLEKRAEMMENGNE